MRRLHKTCMTIYIFIITLRMNLFLFCYRVLNPRSQNKHDPDAIQLIQHAFRVMQSLIIYLIFSSSRGHSVLRNFDTLNKARRKQHQCTVKKLQSEKKSNLNGVAHRPSTKNTSIMDQFKMT